MASANDMSESKTSISGADSYAAIGDYWDQHDLDSHWDQTRDAEFVVDLHGSSIYFDDVNLRLSRHRDGRLRP